MIPRLLRYFGIHLDTVDMAHVPIEKWHQIIDERNRLRRRVQELEAALAAVEQGR